MHINLFHVQKTLYAECRTCILCNFKIMNIYVYVIESVYT